MNATASTSFQSAETPSPVPFTPTFRPLTPEERERNARQSALRAHAARAAIAARQAHQLWPDTGDKRDPAMPVLTPLAEPQPASEPVDGHTLLTDIAKLIDRYLYLPEHGSTLMALWALHAWVPGAGLLSPRLALISPEPQAGKTTALRVLAALTPRPLLTVHARTAPLIRTIDFLKPTLLFDDAERSVWPNRVLRSVLVAGHARDAKILRESRSPFELPALSCFAPCAFSVTGRIPSDIARRAIILNLRPALGSEQRPPFHPDNAEAQTLVRDAVRWARDNGDALGANQPDVGHLPRSQREVWRPLLAFAHAAGGDWIARAETAALAIATQSDARSLNIELLEDIRSAFDDAERLSTDDLLTRLKQDVERPWARMANGRPLNAYDLSKRLVQFNIRPRTMRFADGIVRGYLASNFADAFARYLGPRVYTAWEDL